MQRSRSLSILVQAPICKGHLNRADLTIFTWVVSRHTSITCHALRERLRSFTTTTSPTLKFRWGLVHFWRSWRLSKYSLRQRVQNSSGRCCTRLQCLWAYISAGSNFPGGDSRTLDFIAGRWLGVSGSGESGSVSWLTVRGRLLTIASASHINVLRDSSSSCLELCCKRDESTFRTVCIWHSHTLPMWLADGTFISKVIQSHCSFKRLDLIFLWCILFKASISCRRAPTKLVPRSLRGWWTGPRRLVNRLNAFRNESVTSELAISRWIALEAIHVNMSP